MSTGGRGAGVLALVLGAGDGLDGVAAGEVDGASAGALAIGGGVAGGGVGVSDCGYVTGGADVSASPGDEAGPGEVELDGVALGET